MADVSDPPAMTAATEIHPEDRQLVEKLAKLQTIHGQIHELRSLLPGKLLKPTKLALERPSSISPQQLASSLSLAAANGSHDIRKFKKDFRSEDMQELWSKTNTANFPQGRDVWTKNYVTLAKTYDKVDTTGATANDGSANGAASAPVTQQPAEDVDAVIKAFKESNPGISVTTTAPDVSLQFPLDVHFNNMTFRISRDQEDQAGIPHYQIDLVPSVTKSGMAQQILQHANSEQGAASANDSSAITGAVAIASPSSATASLAAGLSKLASYNGWQFRSCAVCRSIFDDDLKYALVRTRTKTAAESNVDKGQQQQLTFPEWTAYHTGCAPP